MIASGLILVSASSLKGSIEKLDPWEQKFMDEHYHDGGLSSKHWNKRYELPRKFDDDSEECGMNTDIGHTLRIFNGREAKNGEFPWLVQILAGRSSCGGSIISREFVLTAAHCIRPGLETHVVVGLNGDPIKLRAKSFVHSDYDQFNYGTVLIPNPDIALLKLNRPLQWDQHVRPICLPEANDSHLNTGTILTVSGRGKTEDDYHFKDSTRTTDLPIVDVHKCLSYATIKDTQKLDDKMEQLHATLLCAGKQIKEDKLESSTCVGDSGGPATIRRAGKRQWILYGIVSGGDKDCDKGFNLFTKVTGYLDWINGIIEK